MAQAGSAEVAVTLLCVKVAQKAEAVAAFDLMKLAQLFVLALRQPRAAGMRAKMIVERILPVLYERL